MSYNSRRRREEYAEETRKYLHDAYWFERLVCSILGHKNEIIKVHGEEHIICMRCKNN